MGNLPGMGGKKSKGRQQAQRKVKGRSGNPAKRAQQEREASQRRESAPSAPGSAFGLGGAQQKADPGKVELPPGMEKFLGR